MVRRTERDVNIAEAKARLSELVDKAAQGAEILIARDRTPVARLVSVARARGRRTPGSANGQAWIAPDFDELAPDFKRLQHMRLLLDTHAFLWWVEGAPALGCRASAAVSNPGNNVLVSI